VTSFAARRAVIFLGLCVLAVAFVSETEAISFEELVNQAQAATEPKKPKAVHRVDPELEDWSTDHLLGLDEKVPDDYFAALPSQQKRKVHKVVHHAKKKKHVIKKKKHVIKKKHLKKKKVVENRDDALEAEDAAALLSSLTPKTHLKAKTHHKKVRSHKRRSHKAHKKHHMKKKHHAIVEGHALQSVHVEGLSGLGQLHRTEHHSKPLGSVNMLTTHIEDPAYNKSIKKAHKKAHKKEHRDVDEIVDEEEPVEHTEASTDALLSGLDVHQKKKAFVPSQDRLLGTLHLPHATTPLKSSPRDHAKGLRGLASSMLAQADQKAKAVREHKHQVQAERAKQHQHEDAVKKKEEEFRQATGQHTLKLDLSGDTALDDDDDIPSLEDDLGGFMEVHSP